MQTSNKFNDMIKDKGGRGNKVPYDTKVIRVPLEVEERVNHVIQDYRRVKLAGKEYRPEMPQKSFSEAVEEAREIVAGSYHKKEIAAKFAKLVTSLYSIAIFAEDLL